MGNAAFQWQAQGTVLSLRVMETTPGVVNVTSSSGAVLLLGGQRAVPAPRGSSSSAPVSSGLSCSGGSKAQLLSDAHVSDEARARSSSTII